MYLDCVQMVRRRGFGAMESLAGGRSKEPGLLELKRMAQIDWEPALRNGNAWYDRLAAAFRIQDRTARQAELARIEEEVKALKMDTVGSARVGRVLLGVNSSSKTIGDIMICLLTPAVGKVQTAHDRIEQVQRNLHAAFALALYHHDHGTYPRKLGDLAPNYLKEVPGDLFSTKPLVYRLDEKAYLFYSVGVNGLDENGRGNDDNPPGDDLSVRMPLPALKAKK
jgi:hypothetical protein